MARSVSTALCSSKETANFCGEKRHFLSFWFRTIPFHPPQLPWRQKGIGFSTAILSTDGFALDSVKDVFLQLSLNSATRRRQEPQTCFGGHGCLPAPHSPDTTAHRAKRGDFSALRETAVLFVNGVVIPAWSKLRISSLCPSALGPQKWGWASARNCGRRIAGRDACPAERQEISTRILCKQHT